MHLSVFLALGLLSAPSLAQTPEEASPARSAPGPKLLLVDLDDLSVDLLREAHTPTLDALEAEGRFFTNFVTCPMCTPTRAMLHLGAYPSHPDILVGKNIHWSSKESMEVESLVPLGRLVQDAGFRTAKVGKWHLAPRWRVEHPIVFGWQTYRGVICNLQGGGLGYRRYAQVVDGQESIVDGKYLTIEETNDGIACLKDGVDLVSVSYHAPHAPWHVPPPELVTTEPTDVPRDMARAALEACDHELGRLLAVAKEGGYTVLVLSDNGGAAEIGGTKGTFDEGAILMPMWAIGPGVEPGVDDELTSAVDLYATIADHFGIERRVETQGPESISFHRRLGAKPGTEAARGLREFAYSERFQLVGKDPREQPGRWQQSVRTRDYKLVRGLPKQSGDELFDLRRDPAAEHNLAVEPLSEEDAEALTKLRRWLDAL